MLKIWRSAYSRFGNHTEFPDDLLDETVTAEKSYTEEILKEIADNGFNAIWVHGQLHHIIPHPRYPEFAPNSLQHLQALKNLCKKAEKNGIKVYLYLQPPRAIPLSERMEVKRWNPTAMTVQNSRSAPSAPLFRKSGNISENLLLIWQKNYRNWAG